MTINTTGISGINTLQGLAFYTNNAVEGILFTGGSVVFFIVLMVMLLKNDQPFENAFTVSSWIMFLFTAIITYAKLTPIHLPLAFLVFAAFGTLYLYASK